MAKRETPLQEAYKEIDRLKETISSLERRQGIVSLETYTELEENHKNGIEEVRASHEKIASLEKEIRKLKSENFALKKYQDELLEQIADLKLELSKIKGRENICSREDYNRALNGRELAEQETTRIKQDYDVLKKRYEQLKHEHITLNDTCNELKHSKNITFKIHNERGAGRKPKQEEHEHKELILILRNEGNTFKQIQTHLEQQGIKMAIGAIHAIVKSSFKN